MSDNKGKSFKELLNGQELDLDVLNWDEIVPKFEEFFKMKIKINNEVENILIDNNWDKNIYWKYDKSIYIKGLYIGEFRITSDNDLIFILIDTVRYENLNLSDIIKKEVSFLKEIGALDD